MSYTLRIAPVVLVLGLGLGLLFWFRGPILHGSQHEPPETSKSAESVPDLAHYTCSMHPTVHQASPGKCPLCGMDLVPITRTQQREGVVLIDEASRQLIGVKTAPVTHRSAAHSVRAVGRVTYDESTLTDVSVKVSGWVTKLNVNTTGQRVARGQILFMFFSPELYSAQQDYLSARRSGRALSSNARPGDSWTAAGRQRLRLLGMEDGEITRLSSREEPLEAVAVKAPASGFVIEKELVEGASVSAGMRLFRIAKLDTVWVEADLYEADLALAKVGQTVKVTLDFVPGREYSAKVAYIYPYLDAATRTGRVRVELANNELELRPGMYATVELTSQLQDRVLVPISSVVYTGPRRLVFLDLGNGQFKPQEVRLGTQSNGSYEVLDGVKPGDVVATSGTFLIAAEARISTSSDFWDEAAAAAQPVAPVLPAAGYSCPMHPEVRSDGPADCPKCGMKLVQPSPGSTR